MHANPLYKTRVKARGKLNDRATICLVRSRARGIRKSFGLFKMRIQNRLGRIPGYPPDREGQKVFSGFGKKLHGIVRAKLGVRFGAGGPFGFYFVLPGENLSRQTFRPRWAAGRAGKFSSPEFFYPLPLFVSSTLLRLEDSPVRLFLSSLGFDSSFASAKPRNKNLSAGTRRRRSKILSVLFRGGQPIGFVDRIRC